MRGDIMRHLLTSGAAAALVILGLAGTGPPALPAEIRYDGGFIVTPRPAEDRAFAPRYDPYPPMRFYSPRPSYPSGAGGYRFYSDRPSTYGTFYGPAVPAPTPEAPAPPAEPDYGVPAADRPWNQVSFEDYEEPPAVSLNLPPGAAVKYNLEATALPQKVPAENGNVAVLIVHLPEDAALWIEGVLTSAKGRTRYLESPVLAPGKKYRYAVRAAWLEDGRLVSQTREVPVRGGVIYAVYLMASPVTLAKRREARVESNLAKLGPEDQKVARQQKVCVVTDARLGEQGVPVKVMVKSRRVFVCAPDCVQKVLADPDQNLAKALALRARNASKTPGK
jgi:uncharacterized protein (TIGR03000 family)